MEVKASIKSVKLSLAPLKIKGFITNHPRLILVLKLVTVFGIFFISCNSTLDLDFGWHLQAGNFIRAHGIPAHDIFTYTARSFHWIDHEWGSDVLISFLYQYVGYVGLAVLFAGVWSASLFVISRKIGFSFLLLGASAMLPYVVIRPTAWDALGLAIFVALFSARNKRLIWLSPLIILIWANLHGGFVLGLGVILYFAIMRKDRRILYILLSSIAMSFVNPYGPALYTTIYQTLSDVSLHEETTGMAVFYILYSAFPLLIVWGAGFWAVARSKLINWLGLEQVMLVFALAATRNVPLFAVLAVPKASEYFKSIRSKIPKDINKLRQMMISGSVLLVIGVSLYFIMSALFPISNRVANFPVKEVAYLEKNKCSGNLFNDFNYGGYLIWQLPSEPVFIDGRMPSWRNNQGVKYLTIYYRIINSREFMNSEFKTYNIRCVLVENNSSWKGFINRLEGEHWATTINSNSGLLLLAPKSN